LKIGKKIKNMKLKTSLLVVATLVTIIGCSSVPKKNTATVTLKNAYAKDFYIGVALDTTKLWKANQ